MHQTNPYDRMRFPHYYSVHINLVVFQVPDFHFHIHGQNDPYNRVNHFGLFFQLFGNYQGAKK